MWPGSGRAWLGVGRTARGLQNAPCVCAGGECVRVDGGRPAAVSGAGPGGAELIAGARIGAESPCGEGEPETQGHARHRLLPHHRIDNE